MKIDISKKQIINFIIEVEGTDIERIKSRLILFEGPLMLGFDGTVNQNSNGQAEFSFLLPELKSIIKSENVKATMEMFVEDRFFVPYETTFDIERPVVFKVNEERIKTQNDNPISAGTKVSLKDIKTVPLNEEELISNEKKQIKEEIVIEKMTLDLESLIRSYEETKDIDTLKKETHECITQTGVFSLLSEDNKQKVAVLKSKRIKTTDQYFKIITGIIKEMSDLGVEVIING